MALEKSGGKVQARRAVSKALDAYVGLLWSEESLGRIDRYYDWWDRHLVLGFLGLLPLAAVQMVIFLLWAIPLIAVVVGPWVSLGLLVWWLA